MSTLLYERITRAREVSTPSQPPELMMARAAGQTETKPVGKLVDMVAAFVPVEVLAGHAAVLGWVSTSSDPAAGPVTVTITDMDLAGTGWWALLIVAFLLYVIPHALRGGLDGWDIVRSLLPPAAFVAWTAAQKSTLFDGVWTGSNDVRVIGGVVVGIAVLAISYGLADRAEAKP